MKNVKLETLSTQDIPQKQGKRIRKNINRNINAIINFIQSYFYSIKEIFLYYLSFFINLVNNFILAVVKKRNEKIIFIKGEEIKKITRNDCHDIKENKKKIL